jgi:hypothetical protein
LTSVAGSPINGPVEPEEAASQGPSARVVLEDRVALAALATFPVLVAGLPLLPLNAGL